MKMNLVHKLGFWLLRKYPKVEVKINNVIIFGGEKTSAITIRNSNPLVSVHIEKSTILPEDARAKYKVDGKWMVIQEGKKKSSQLSGIQLIGQGAL